MDLSLSIKATSTESWTSGGNGTISLTNDSPSLLQDWSVTVKTSNFTITSTWDFEMKKIDENTYVLSGKPWNLNLDGKTTVTSGFGYSGTDHSNLLIEVVNSPSTMVSSSSPASSSIVSPDAITLSPDSKKIFAYFAEWSIYDRQFNPDMIQANKITHLMYAFMVPNPSQSDFDVLTAHNPHPIKPYLNTLPEGTLTTHDVWAARQKTFDGHNGIIGYLQHLKLKYPHLKIIISVGGWTMSWNFSHIAANPVTRSTFARSTAAFLTKHGFDGVDIDWEYVGVKGADYNFVDPVNDPPNFIKLLAEIRMEFDKASPSKHLEITVATGANPKVINNYRGTEPYLDYMLLMTYDFYGGFGDGGHQSGFFHNAQHRGANDGFTVEAAINNAVNVGFPKSKLAVGVPFYGRGWSRLESNGSLPIFGKKSGEAARSYSKWGEPGMTSWHDLRQQINKNGLNEYYDDIAQVPYCFNQSTGECWTYDNVRSTTFKAEYVKNNGLAGMLCWELSDDSRDGNEALLDVMSSILIKKQ